MVYRSPRPPVEIPDTPVADFVLARAPSRGDRPALVDSLSGRTVTYAQLPDLVDRAAAGLSRLGLGKGDVCAILSPNTPEYPIAMLAIARLGAIATTASPLYTRADLGRHLTDSRARILITSTSLTNTWTGVTTDDGHPARRHLRISEWARRSHSTIAHRALRHLEGHDRSSDIVALPYSSGTTGLPKGVMLTHRNLVANILQLDPRATYLHDQDTDDRVSALLPHLRHGGHRPARTCGRAPRSS